MADDFFTKQLPHNVTWGLTVLYALDASKDLSDLAAQVGLPPWRHHFEACLKLDQSCVTSSMMCKTGRLEFFGLIIACDSRGNW